jgi:hypothetical protein
MTTFDVCRLGVVRHWASCCASVPNPTSNRFYFMASMIFDPEANTPRFGPSNLAPDAAWRSFSCSWLSVWVQR